MKLFKTVIISLILLLFINVKSQGQMTLNFRCNTDTIYPNKDVKFINTSTNVRMGTVFKWKFINGLYNSHLGTLYNIEKTTYSVSDSITCFFNASDTIRSKLYAFYNNVCIDSISKTFRLNSYKIYSCQPSDPCMIMCNNGFEDTAALGHTYHYFLLSANDAIAWDGTNIGVPHPTPDLFVRNYPYNYGRSGIPDNNFGILDNSSINGNVYAGIITYLLDNNGDPMEQREFIHQPLSRPLVAGRKYLVGMYYALADASAYGSNNLGICLTVNQNTQQGVGNPSSPTWLNSFIPDGVLNPQVELNHVVDYKEFWTKLQDTITATDNFQHLYVGGFKGNNNTTYYHFGDYTWPDQTSPGIIPDTSSTGTYYYIDSVFVIPIHNGKHNPIKICLGKDTIINAPSPPPGTGDMVVENSWYNTATGQTTNDQAQYNIHVSGNNTIICTTVETYFYDLNNPCTTKDTFYITAIHPKPIITSFGNYCFGDSITFTGSALPCENGVTAWNWSFGNGATANTKVTKYRYPVAGTYTVTLVITDISGDTHDTTMQITIIPPVAMQVTGPNNSCDLTSYYNISPWLTQGGVYQYRRVPGTGWVGISSSQFTVTYPNNTDSANLYIRYISPNGCITADTIHIFECCTVDNFVIWANDTIKSDSTITRGHVINGTVVINANIIFKHGSVRMGPEARFVVMAGKSLIFNRAIVEEGCNYMWDGIYAESLNSLIKIDSLSIVGDAINGIVASNGGQIFLRNSTFRNNYYNVIIRNYTTANNLAYISGCKFIGSDALTYQPMSPQATLVGIAIDSVGNEYSGTGSVFYATIGDTIAGTTGGSISNSKCNYFRKTGVGIFVKNSNANIYNCYFSKEINTYGTGSAVYIQGKIIPAGQPNNKKHFVNIGGSNPKRIVVDSSYVGVYSAKNIDLKVVKCKFYNNLIGVIYAENNYYINLFNKSNNVYLHYNTFLTCLYSIYSTSNNVCRSYIRYNRINDSTTTTGWYSNGILMNGSQQNNETAEITFNKITAKGTGILSLAFANNLKINDNFIKLPAYPNTSTTFGIQVQNCYNAFIERNVVTTPDSLASYGISVEQSNSAKVRCDSVRGLEFGIRFAGANLPGNLSSVKGNSFNKCFRGLVKTDNGIIGNQISSTECSDNKWYNYTGNYAHTFCYGSYGEVIYSRNIISGIYNPAINGVSGGAAFSKQLGTSILYVCGALPQGMMSSIQTNSTNDAVNLYESIADESNNYSLGNITAEYLTKQSLYKLILNEPALFASNINIQQFKADNDNLSMGQITRAEFLLSNNDILNAAVLNNSAQPNNQIEEKLKMMIAYKIQLLKTDSLSANQLDDIRELAKKCPFELGTSVYFARAVISKYDLNIRYNNPCEYIGIVKNKIFEPSTPDDGENTELQHADIRVMPNPANDKLSIELNLETTGNNCIFELYDLTGKKLISMILPHGNLNDIKLTEIIEGVYIYKILINGVIAKTDKLIIIK